jgi:hypothetical protein
MEVKNNEAVSGPIDNFCVVLNGLDIVGWTVNDDTTDAEIEAQINEYKHSTAARYLEAINTRRWTTAHHRMKVSDFEANAVLE